MEGNLIKLSKGLDIHLQGKAEEKKIQLKSNGKYALMPDDFEGVTPKVVVKEGDKVKAGDALFVNKQYPQVKFASPVSGTVREVVRGERRKVLCIKVDADAQRASDKRAARSRIVWLHQSVALCCVYQSRD